MPHIEDDMSMEERADAQQLAIQQLHGCLESHRDETRASFAVVTSKLGELTTLIDIGNGQNAALAKRLGIVGKDGAVQEAKAVKPAPGAWSLKKMALTVLPVLSGVVLLAQLLIPPIQAGAVAFYHALMSAH
jgi:hypothetical protein